MHRAADLLVDQDIRRADVDVRIRSERDLSCTVRILIVSDDHVQEVGIGLRIRLHHMSLVELQIHTVHHLAAEGGRQFKEDMPLHTLPQRRHIGLTVRDVLCVVHHDPFIGSEGEGQVSVPSRDAQALSLIQDVRDPLVLLLVRFPVQGTGIEEEVHHGVIADVRLLSEMFIGNADQRPPGLLPAQGTDLPHRLLIEGDLLSGNIPALIEVERAAKAQITVRPLHAVRLDPGHPADLLFTAVGQDAMLDGLAHVLDLSEAACLDHLRINCFGQRHRLRFHHHDHDLLARLHLQRIVHKHRAELLPALIQISHSHPPSEQVLFVFLSACPAAHSSISKRLSSSRSLYRKSLT